MCYPVYSSDRGITRKSSACQFGLNTSLRITVAVRVSIKSPICSLAETAMEKIALSFPAPKATLIFYVTIGYTIEYEIISHSLSLDE